MHLNMHIVNCGCDVMCGSCDCVCYACSGRFVINCGCNVMCGSCGSCDCF